MSVNIFKNNVLKKIALGMKVIAVTLTNNLLATEAGTALDAVQGKVLDDKINEVKESLFDVDIEMSDTSTNPVQNKVIKKYVDDKQVNISSEDNNAIENKPDGIYAKDKSDEIKKIQNDIAPITKYSKYVNTDLDYCYLKAEASNIELSSNQVVPFNIRSDGNMGYNVDNYSILLKANKTYEISCDFLTDGTGYTYINIYDLTHDKVITSFGKTASNYNTNNSNSGGSCIYTTNEDCEVQIKMRDIVGSIRLYNRVDDAYFIAKEVNRAITIDPLEYVNESQGIEDTPVGHIIPYMGNNAPKHYLVCDGTEYNITDYPYLTQHFIDEFGSVNYFGGDGTTTFAVPDLRGEFLRGTGTATRATGSGADVGEHQDGTSILSLWSHSDNNRLYFRGDGAKYSNEDLTSNDEGSGLYSASSTAEASTSYPKTITTRPTNTSVLYCIKYEPTYYMKVEGKDVYSMDEKMIGYWIDGKPIYRKCYNYTNSGSNIAIADLSLLNIDTFCNVYGTYTFTSDGLKCNLSYSVGNNSSGMYSAPYYNPTDKTLHLNTNQACSGVVIIEYTKTTD